MMGMGSVFRVQDRSARIRRLRLLHLLSAAACVLSPSTLRAEIFWRLPKGADSTLQELGGTRVYATAVQINGTPGTLATYAFSTSAQSVSAGLVRRLGLPPAAPFGGTLMSHVEKGRMRRLMILPGAGAEACVVLSLDQSLDDYTRALKEPPTWPEGLPALSASPLFSAVCAGTRTSFVTAESASSPEEAVQEAAQMLLSAGWAETSPSAPTFKIFASGRKVCLLLASRNAQTERTTISVLQREGATP